MSVFLFQSVSWLRTQDSTCIAYHTQVHTLLLGHSHQDTCPHKSLYLEMHPLRPESIKCLNQRSPPPFPPSASTAFLPETLWPFLPPPPYSCPEGQSLEVSSLWAAPAREEFLAGSAGLGLGAWSSGLGWRLRGEASRGTKWRLLILRLDALWEWDERERRFSNLPSRQSHLLVDCASHPPPPSTLLGEGQGRDSILPGPAACTRQVRAYRGAGGGAGRAGGGVLT